jgi:hypothetical protein
MLKQLALQDVIGDSGWRVDLQEGGIWFGDDGPHPIQLLGTEGFGDQTWFWAWANSGSDLPAEVIRASERLRGIGAERKIPELITPKMPLRQADGHMLSIVACGLLQGASYYRGPYEGGAAFFLLPDFPPPARVDASPLRLIRAVTMAISSYPLDHGAVIAGLAADLALPLRERPGAVNVTAANGEEIELELDKMGRIAKMSSIMRKG